MSARAVMVLGTTSGAGKSFLATALARFYSNAGFRVAPFKAQNMSNNARVVEDGEIGSAQYFQALAARTLPDVHMNPVLLKPESERHSQLIVHGRRRDDLADLGWAERAARLKPLVLDSLDELRARCEILVIEGAGSPAEINLYGSDLVNLPIARAAAANAVIVCDIDRGGAFAHLYGTHQLLPAEDRGLIRGFILNKFRGDPALLEPAPRQLHELTGVRTLGVLPLWREHGLPEEDGLYDERPAGEGLKIAIVAYPHFSNHDEFAPLRRAPCSLLWARRPETVAAAELLILPGSKHVAADLDWLRRTGLAEAIAAHVRAGKPTLAVCGGLQMLGTEIRDPHGVEGAADALALLPLSTELQRDKRTARGRYTFGELSGFWRGLSALSVEGYEIHHGTSAGERAGAALRPVLGAGLGWQSGETLALYLHGLFENEGVLRALFGARAPLLEEVFEGLAGFVERHLGAATLMSLLERPG